MARSVEQLFVRFRSAGDVSALAEVFERTAPELLRVGLHLARDPAAAEDLLQATFVVAMETADSFDADRRLVPWLLGILTNQYRKRRWRDARAVDPARVPRSQPADPGRAAQEREFSSALAKAVDQLHEPYRQVLVLHLRHGLAPAEVADVLRRSPGTVRSQLARGLEMLRDALPVGFTAAALGLLPGRGLAAVKRGILNHAATLTAPSLLGAFAMKKTLLSTAGLLFVAVVGVLAIPQLSGAGSAVPAGPLQQDVIPARTQLPTASLENASDLGRRGASAEGRAPVEASESAAAAFGSVVVRLVWDDTGAPAAGVAAYVVAWARSNRKLYQEYGLSDDHGIVQYDEVYRGPVTVYTMVGGHVRAEVRGGEETALEVRVPRGIHVAGFVVDRDGRPVPHADVWLCAAGAEFRGVRVVQADAWGGFQVPGLSANNLLGARKAGFSPSDLQEVDSLPDDEVSWRRRIELVLPDSGSGVTGVVVDGAGEPVAGAQVQFHPAREQDEWGRIEMRPGATLPLRLTTAPDGSFATADLPAVDTVVSARRPDRVPARAEVSLVAGETSEVRLVLERGVTLVGKVTDRSGLPIEGAHVDSGDYGYFSHYSATTDAGGNYRLEGLPADPEVQAFTGAGRHLVAKLAGAPGETVRWDPVLTGGNEIRGRLLDAAETPLGGWDVWARGPRGQAGTATTDPQGFFTLSNRLDEEHTLEVRAAGELFTLPPLLTVTGVRPDDELLELRVPKTSLELGSIVGMIIDDEDRPMHAVIRGTYGDGQSIVLKQESRADTGVFVFDRLPPMEYRLKVHAEGYPATETTVTVFPGGKSDAGALRLSKGGRLALRLLRSDGQHPSVTSSRLIGPSGAIPLRETGGVWAAVLAAGSYRLVIEGEDFLRHEQLLELTGDAHEARVELVTAHRQAFRFTLPGSADFPYRLHLVLRDEQEKVVREASLLGDPTQPYRWAVGLGPGGYRLEVSTSTGSTAEVAFRIANVAEEPPTITVRLE